MVISGLGTDSDLQNHKQDGVEGSIRIKPKPLRADLVEVAVRCCKSRQENKYLSATISYDVTAMCEMTIKNYF